MLIYRINTMTPGGDYGTVLSAHRTVEAAERAYDAHADRIRRHEGSTSYLPMRIARLPYRARRGQIVALRDAEPIGGL